MTPDQKGREHLEALLGRYEKVVRLTPSDLLVLMGADDPHEPHEFAVLRDVMTALGIPVRGVIALGKGVGLESIDMKLVAQMERAQPRDGSQGTIGLGAPVVLHVTCPRCDGQIPLPVQPGVRDDGASLYPVVGVDGSDLGIHGLSCSGPVADGV